MEIIYVIYHTIEYHECEGSAQEPMDRELAMAAGGEPLISGWLDSMLCDSLAFADDETDEEWAYKIAADGSGDEDGDGRTDLDEVRVNPMTDPCNPDSDGDGLSDGEEVADGSDGFITDPNNPDTDGDGTLDNIDPDPTNPNIP